MARDKIFISYRRDDAAADAQSIYQYLAQRFGKRRIFMDVDSIQPGRDFRDILKASLARTRVLLVLIGPRWNEGGRLHGESDFVRLEVREALSAGIPVIPVTLGETPLPAPETLPEDVQPLIFRHKLGVRYESFGSDMAALERALRHPGGARRGVLAGLVAALALIGGLGWAWSEGLFQWPPSGPDPKPVAVAGGGTQPDIPASPLKPQLEPRALETETAWALVATTTDIEALKRYRERFPGSIHDADAAARIAELEKAAARRAREARLAALLTGDDIDALQAFITAGPQDNLAGRASERVIALYREGQEQLKRLRLYDGSVDGDWGFGSRSAMRRFQRAKGLSEDGRLSAASLAMLRKSDPKDFEQKYADGQRFRDCPDCPEMVVIPAGSFMMGSPENEPGRDGDEGPRHRVTLERFALGRTEVTRGEFARFVRETGHDAGDKCRTYKDGSWDWRDGLTWRDPGFSQTDDHPVVCVSWEDLQAYVTWLSQKSGERYRLPSESEQEYAARGRTETAYLWGTDENAGCAWANGADRQSGFSWASNCDDGFARTAPVGSFRANDFGLADVIGNVWEWGQDCWNDSYAGAPTDGSPWDTGDCSRAVLRGGSWNSDPRNLRSANRSRFLRVFRSHLIGFRVARTLPH